MPPADSRQSRWGNIEDIAPTSRRLLCTWINDRSSPPVAGCRCDLPGRPYVNEGAGSTPLRMALAELECGSAPTIHGPGWARCNLDLQPYLPAAHPPTG